MTAADQVTYRTGILPGSDLWVPCCNICGALTTEPALHTDWHVNAVNVPNLAAALRVVWRGGKHIVPGPGGGTFDYERWATAVIQELRS